jgi:hypothetical protein
VIWLSRDAKKPACQANCDHSHTTLSNNCEILSEIEKEFTTLIDRGFTPFWHYFSHITASKLDLTEVFGFEGLCFPEGPK